MCKLVFRAGRVLKTVFNRERDEIVSELLQILFSVIFD